MANFVETLKQRAADAFKRMTEAQQKLNAANAEFQNANNELQAWARAYASEAQRLGLPVEPIAPHPQQQTQHPIVVQAGGVVLQPARKPPIPDINKTEIIKNSVLAHQGVRPVEVWNEVKAKAPVERNYVYSVLKRLKDRGEVIEKRGRYYKPEKQEATAEATAVQ